jgi:beta-lactamase class A
MAAVRARRLAALVASVLVLGAAAHAAAQDPPAAARAGAAGGWQPDIATAEAYADRRRGDVRFAFIDMDGRMYRHKATRTSPSASVFKAMLLVTYLRRASVKERPLRERDRDLLGPMIRRSDNETATRVRDIVGRRAVERLARAAGMRDFAWNWTWGLSRISARDQAPFFYRIEDYIPGRHEDYARRLLANIVSWQRWGIAQAVPEGWKIYFKGGWGIATGRVNHQIAFLENGGQRVALAILTEWSPNHEYGTETQEGLARRLFEGLPTTPEP